LGPGAFRIAAGVARAIDRLNEFIGRCVSWLVVTMVLTTFAVAVLRYGVNIGWIWLQETYVWMHGLIIMVASGYALLHDSHVRVDIFYRPASRRFKAWVNLVGVFLFLLPMLAVVAWAVWPYVLLSWQRLETSGEAGGMPALYLLKSALVAFCVLVALQGVSLAIRSAIVLLQGETPGDPSPRGERPVH
jgi:TRAP-type mannitol/chloroaromatic compound transport system permease small subunit